MLLVRTRFFFWLPFTKAADTAHLYPCCGQSLPHTQPTGPSQGRCGTSLDQLADTSGPSASADAYCEIPPPHSGGLLPPHSYGPYDLTHDGLFGFEQQYDQGCAGFDGLQEQESMADGMPDLQALRE